MASKKSVEETRRVWLSFDFGVQGDYESLYVWLDEHQAKECGDNVATFTFTYSGDDIVGALLKSIRANVTLRKRDRLYFVRPVGDSLTGSFIHGRRKPPAWQGRAVGLSSYQPPDEDA